MSSDWIPLTPKVEHFSRTGRRFVHRVVRRLQTVADPMEVDREAVEEVRLQALEKALDFGAEAQLHRLIASALCDLRLQGWDMRVHRSQPQLRRPQDSADRDEQKGLVRAALQVERDRQVRSKPTQRFLKSMETRRLRGSNWISVYSIMRDGADLAAQLRPVLNLPEAEKTSALGQVIRPYLQVVDGSKCIHSGYPLKHIWRYFRHTWTTPYKSIPGRGISFLVRDSAAPFHPVIGIGTLGSSFMQLSSRDKWIGWSRREFLARLRSQPTKRWAAWVLERLEEQIRSVYTEDFLDGGRFRPGDIENPTTEVIEHLRGVGTRARLRHQRYALNTDHKGTPAEKVDWKHRAETDLFVSKRAVLFANLLQVRKTFRKLGLTTPSTKGLAAVLESAEGRRAVSVVLKRWRDERVGNDVMDIVVCGAVPPYNHLIGGKLVGLMLASPEAVGAAEERYSRKPNVIASGIAGRPVRRRPKIVVLGTTGLYGTGSSQYNRLRMPACAAGGSEDEELRYYELGSTEGYGSYHFSQPTMKEARALVEQSATEQRARNIFGEGGNPRWRGLRDALELAGLPSGNMLKHGASRVVYGIPLAGNFQDVLLGVGKRPKYILPRGNHELVTQQIAEFWRRRWVANRISRDGILDRIAAETLTYPVNHGARVSRPASAPQ